MPKHSIKPDPVKVARQLATLRRFPSLKLKIKSDPPPDPPDSKEWRDGLLCTLGKVALFAHSLDELSGDNADVVEADRLATELQCADIDLDPETEVEGWSRQGDPLTPQKRSRIQDLIRCLRASRRMAVRDPHAYAHRIHETLRMVVEVFNLPEPLSALGFAPADTEPTSRKDQPTTRPIKAKEPTKEEVAIYRFYIICGQNQTETARWMTERGVHTRQYKVSRVVRKVNAWLKAGNVLPPLNEEVSSRPEVVTVDPLKLEAGPRLRPGKPQKHH
ncbi:MAG: hypothetical protein QUV05_08080 [Phycisphaerae bacterium]|nr:hypothetical protein [Phycisphaerae bacterium]